MNKIYTCLRREDGVTAVEFALVAPALFYMMIGILELSLMFFTQHLMENASFNASRLGKTGFVATGMTREETIRQMMVDRTYGLLNADNIEIVSKSYSKYSAVGQPEPYVDANSNGEYDEGENFTDMNGNGIWDKDRGKYSAGESGEVVIYNISYPWHTMTPYMSEMFGNDGSLTLRANVIVKNEPYKVE